ncbi:thiaminase II [Aerophototrophica crusticola]|uniref:Aminopyrimidine aminohydrolase n=1 Tax=Aerophototrophica crusticola TaxID=1709002 RepID=A0A858R4V2_9PROT|nr:thiaminase II [Rhodospirillaceae bacterium B3]
MSPVAGAALPDLATSGGLFARLRDAARPSWESYVAHPFVKGMGDGSLPEASFRHYLVQDYLFLIHFARAYALAAYKADSLADMRSAARSMSAILDLEMGLHVKYCAGWGLSEADMAATPEAQATLAYTRFVLERGMAGDLLDLHVALAPCVVGYAEIAAGLLADAATRLDGNPYRAWIEMYADPEYRTVAHAQVELLDRLSSARGGEARFADLTRTFDAASRLEAGFWEMGLTLAG